MILGLRGGDLNQMLKFTKTNVDYVDIHGRIALSWAAKCGNGDALTALLKHRASPFLADFRGVMPLHRAAAAPNSSCIEPLLLAGVSADARDFQNSTALQCSCLYLETDISNFYDPLLAAGADVNAQTSFDHNPLHIAIQRGMTNNSFYLIKNGASFDICDKFGISNIMYIVELNRHSLFY